MQRPEGSGVRGAEGASEPTPPFVTPPLSCHRRTFTPNGLTAVITITSTAHPWNGGLCMLCMRLDPLPGDVELDAPHRVMLLGPGLPRRLGVPGGHREPLPATRPSPPLTLMREALSNQAPHPDEALRNQP